MRELRERQGISLDELSRATRVLHHYLEALEADDMASLPAPVFTRGFIRAYCQALGVEPARGAPIYDRIGVPAPDLTKRAGERGSRRFDAAGPGRARLNRTG